MDNENQDLAQVLTLSEAAERLRVCKKTVLNMIRKDKLPARKVGRAWRISTRAIEEWLSSGSDEIGKSPNPKVKAKEY